MDPQTTNSQIVRFRSPAHLVDYKFFMRLSAIERARISAAIVKDVFAFALTPSPLKLSKCKKK